jgi:glycosyltransferase involved in cell wall biosynthesis
MRLVQDVAVPHGGAERVARAALLSGLFDRVLIGVGDLGSLPDGVFSERVATQMNWATEDHVQVLRNLYERLLEYPPLSGKSMVFHHHAGLLFRHLESPVVYMHTVTRSIWEPERVPWEADAIVGLRSAIVERELTTLSQATAIITNSLHTGDRIRAFYGLETAILSPPVWLWRGPRQALNRPDLENPFVLCISRLTSGKNLHRLLDAASWLSQTLVVVGTGRLQEELVLRASKNVLFIGNVADTELRWLIGRATAVVAPGVEDYGLTSLESICEGTACVVPDVGGQLEHLDETVSATFPARGDGEDIALAIDAASALVIDDSTRNRYRKHFGLEQFVARLRAIIEDGESTK